MNVARLELCKELFELSGWAGLEDLPRTKEMLINYFSEVFVPGYGGTPQYTLGYLLRKFAGKGGVEIRYGDKGCIASSQMRSIEADTPEDAVAMLAIELFQQGVLKKE